MPNLAATLITLGALLLLGFVADGLGRRTKLPRVTVLLVLGFFIGPSFLGLLPAPSAPWSTTVTHIWRS